MDIKNGVNLGGWLVLERWIAPSVFEGTDAQDEYSLSQTLENEEFSTRLKIHRETFITEDHIKQFVARAVDFVRLPVGYWLFESQDGFISADTYVDRVFEWAKTHGLKVILDLHAPKGSQNGWDHSGRSGDIIWQTSPELASADTLEFLSQLTVRYGHMPQLAGVEVLNEPHWDVSLESLISFYQRAYDVIRQNSHSDVSVILSDAFRPEAMSKRIEKLKLQNVVLDVHLYQLFTPEDRALTLDGHIYKVTKDWQKLLKRLAKHHRVLVGEWSGAMSELYSTPHGEFQHSYSSKDYARYFEIQKDIYNSHAYCQSYWTARTEDGGVWSFLDQPEFSFK